MGNFVGKTKYYYFDDGKGMLTEGETVSREKWYLSGEIAGKGLCCFIGAMPLERRLLIIGTLSSLNTL